MPMIRYTPPQTTSAEETPTLQSLFRAAAHRQNLCVLALLTWVASCDGSIDDEELQLLRMVASGVAGGEDVLPAVVDVARLGQPEDLELACRYIRNHSARADRPLLAQLFITMAAQDGNVTVAENHVLRFLADLLGLSAWKFARLFEEVTRRPFPDVGDVSSMEWWRRREAGREARAPDGGWGATRETRPPAGAPPADQAAAPHPAKGPMSREAALRLFGLERGASADAIRAAYRRLAKARHPDRFAGLGAAAQATATLAFERVRDAYSVLSA